MKEMRIKKEVLRRFCIDIFCKAGLDKNDAATCSDVLISASLRGLYSHGIDALKRYVDGIKEGIISPNSRPKIISENEITLLVDACASMGMVSGNMVMNKIIGKAKKYGMGIGTVKNANHFGFGAYYAILASNENMIGLVMSNTAAIAVPTYGVKAMLGTNPISFAAPSNKNVDFVLDMATTTVPRGVVKGFADRDENIPKGWAINEKNEYITDAKNVINILSNNLGGGLVPLGGKDTVLGGHKGYGLGIMVDILTGILSGFNASYEIKDTKKAAGKSAHTFIVINIQFFREVEEFKRDMDKLLDTLKNAPAIEGKEVVFHGQKEAENTKNQNLEGINVSKSTYESLREMENKYHVNKEMFKAI